ncbi:MULTISPECIES: MFS transporter [unclassified Caballeronia]|uniref:MFS transporter n=1 Tax=unclassified Caballeronia TaxID=2646786 RepID=UPI00286413E3|nr:MULTISPECIES: MFS transporter [unclassified Caballeronia]MDR5755145.1 MFS transporter [Caballeronia sp. LZ024]MDR5841589.1 MFS transporter [Caballeronia sp. LZ031]
METSKPGLTHPWAALALLALGVLISFVDRTSISATLADADFIRHFALNDVDRGLINAAFFWSYGVFQIPMGWVADRYGVKWPYAISFALWCVATALMGAVTALTSLVVMRLIIGMAEAIVIPASYRWIRNNFDESQNGLAVGILAMGNKFGPALGAPVGAWFIVHYSWQTMFVVTGLVGLFWLVPWLTMVRSDFPSKAQIAISDRSARSVSLGSIMTSPVVWGGMITNFCYGYFTFYCMTWMPAYLVEQRNLSISRSGLFTFFSFAGIAIVAALAGWAADRVIASGRDPILVRKVFTVTGFTGGCTVLLGAYANSLEMALFWNVLSLSLLGLVTANNLVLSRLTLIPKQAIGLVTGVQQVATSLAGGVASSLSGWLLHKSGSYDVPMMVILGFLVVGAMATILLYRPEWAPKVTEQHGTLRRA